MKNFVFTHDNKGYEPFTGENLNDYVSDEELRDLFLALWDKAKSEHYYSKKEWQELRRMLKTRGIDV